MKRLYDDDKELLIELYRKGVSPSKIGKQIGKSPSSVLGYVKRILSPEEIAEIRATRPVFRRRQRSKRRVR